MDVAVLPLTGFTSAAWSLRRRRKPGLNAILERLRQARFVAQCARILAELDPARLAELRPRYLGEPGEHEDFVGATLEAIGEIAPLDREFLDMVLMEGEELPYLHPEPCGFPMSWDDWDSMTRSLEDYSDNVGLFVFVTALRLGDPEALQAASDHFGWDLPAIDFERYGEVDWARLNRLLDRNRLGCFKLAIDACLYSTGNAYFDYNPYDDDTGGEGFDLPPFTLAGVCALEAEWQAAQPILADYRQAERMFIEDRDLAKLILRKWLLCCPKVEKKRRRTLAELWNDPPERMIGWDETPERVIDPFREAYPSVYGPLDGQGDPDEEEEE